MSKRVQFTTKLFVVFISYLYFTIQLGQDKVCTQIKDRKKPTEVFCK